MKYWGRGPKNWTAKLLQFEQPPSNAHLDRSGTSQDTMYLSARNEDVPLPAELCQWFIHVYQHDYDRIPDVHPESALSAVCDPDDDSTWEPWAPSKSQAPIHTVLRDALEHNDFSPGPTANLPIAIPQIAKAAERSPNELLLESLGFAIMSRNASQVSDILEELDGVNGEDVDPLSLHPFHLAISYLDGAKACCEVIHELTNYIQGAQVHTTYVNNDGHTMLDALMISIIKSHTSATPFTVDHNMRDVARFTGEEVDVCGRWDADSHCVRQLYAAGHTSIPPNWKHKFCHTSIQVVCHCMIRMFYLMPTALLLETPSGLYIRRCFDCGKKLQLQPLHSLVMTAYHLATQGCADEDLFGILACALCLISHDMDPSTKADISVTALLDTDAILECDHEELTAAALAERISDLPAVRSWSTKLQTGWVIMSGVLRRCETANNEPEDKIDEGADQDFFSERMKPQPCYNGYHHPATCFLNSNDLGTLWASIQAELLSYRRLTDDLPWISDRFSMDSLREQIERGQELKVGYVEHDLLKEHCVCHGFGGYPLVLLEDALDPNLANLEGWGRANFGTCEFGTCE